MEQNSLIDLKAISEPVVKLIDTVSNAVGVIYEPTKLKRMARAEVEIAKIKAEGEFELQQLIERTSERVDAKELRRQKNIESITKEAIALLPEKVSTEKVDEDWTISFFENCQDISNEQMQTLWSKILAGEVSSPQSFSLRTLNFVKTMSKEDAILFSKFCNYIWEEDDLAPTMFHHFKTETTVRYLSDISLRPVDFAHLESIGLIFLEEVLPLHTCDNAEINAWYGEKNFVFSGLSENIKTDLDTNRLTPIGNELARLRDFVPDYEYVSILKQSLIPYVTLQELK